MNAMRITRAITAAMLCLATPLAAAQAWPSKPVRMVAVFPPGGSVDQVARVLAQQLSVQLGQTFLVDNKGGASGSIGTAEVARAAPDGYTFAVVFDTHAVNPSLIPNLSFNTTKDLAPVILIGTSPMALVTPASQPYKDFRDVVAAAKAKPGSVAFGTIGAGSLGHLAMAQIGNQLGVEFTHVPYRGGGPLMNDAIGGQVPLAIGTVFLVAPHVKSGKGPCARCDVRHARSAAPRRAAHRRPRRARLRGGRVVGDLRPGGNAGADRPAHARRVGEGAQGSRRRGATDRPGHGHSAAGRPTNCSRS
jgi:tripartite-type tricarboxylate transporter receptor subunit TctC